MGARQFGARVPRVEDPALLTGRARFVDDVKLPGTLHAAFVRSPHAHARIGAIDTAAALAMPGVHAVLTANDLPGRLATEPLPMPVPNAAITALRTQHALARDEVCYVGEAIAVVVADNRYLAEDAAAAVAVDYECLPPPATAATRSPRARRAATATSPPMSPPSSPWPMAMWSAPLPRRPMCSRRRFSSIAAPQ
jgi:carbon-monoxide dehydrogenase large subunit